MQALVDALLDGFRGAAPSGVALADPGSLRDGQAVQLAVLDRLLADGERLAGWKVGLTSGAARDAFGRGVRPPGFILESRVYSCGASGARLDVRRARPFGVENELCFVLAAPLGGPSVTAADARAAVGGVAPAFEINETRLPPDAPPALRIADDLSQWGLVVGDVVAPVPRDLDFDSVAVVLRRDGEVVEHRLARGHIDDHFESIASLARALAAFGRRLRSGDRVITGSFTRQAVTGPSRWEGQFDPFGTVAVEFVDARAGATPRRPQPTR